MVEGAPAAPQARATAQRLRSDTVVQRHRRWIFALGPLWVRAARSYTGIGSHQRFRGTAGRRPPAQAAAMMRMGESDCGPEGQAWVRRAADGQQPVSVTTGEPVRKPWRVMTADPAIDGH
jgi:hypothetical protein